MKRTVYNCAASMSPSPVANAAQSGAHVQGIRVDDRVQRMIAPRLP